MYLTGKSNMTSSQSSVDVLVACELGITNIRSRIVSPFRVYTLTTTC